MGEQDKLRDEEKTWQKAYEKETARRGERKRFVTLSGIPLRPLYTPLDIPAEGYLENSGFPGGFPFTRGVYTTMYRVRPWTIRQYAGFGRAEQTNERFRFLLSQGQKGLSVAFDLPTQMGYDSDHPLARGEVGRVGVAVDTLEDIRILFREIPLEEISTSMTINATAPVLLAMYVALAEERGVDRKRLAGTVQNDVLKEYIARGTYIFPPGPSLKLVTDTIAWCSRELPGWNPISISGYHIREAGATAVQELAFTLADALAYTRAAIEAGLDVDSFAPRLSFFFNVHNNFFEEVAKFRAARRLWAGMMRNRFRARRPESMRLRFHTQTAGSTLTAQQAQNNIVRVTIQALAAVLGGTQSLHTNSLDEALGLPSDEAAKVALRTQQIILEESGAADVIDPLGGSYLVEKLTNEIHSRARELIEEIESMGGMVAAIERAFPQREIEKSSYAYQRMIEKGEVKVVGVNVHCDPDYSPPEALAVDPALEKEQVDRLVQVRASRDQKRVKESLAAVQEAALADENVLPPILAAVKAMATVGEICSALADIYGRHREERKRGRR